MMAVLKFHELFLPWLKRLQKVFAPRNRPFICYVVFVAMGLALAGGLWSGHVKLPGWLADGTLKIFSREFLVANLPTPAGFWSMGLSSLCVFWVITHPMELREHRLVRIAISGALIYWLLSGIGKPLDLTFAGSGHNTFSFFGFLLPIAVLAGMWTPALSFYLAAALTVFMEPPSGPDPEPGLRPAYGAARAGLSRQALRLVRPALRENFHHYEGLVLAAWLHRHLGRRWRTRFTLLCALQNPGLFEAQRERLLDLMGHMDELSRDCWQIPGLGRPGLVGQPVTGRLHCC